MMVARGTTSAYRGPVAFCLLAPLLPFASHLPAGCRVACCRVPPPRVTFRRTAASRVQTMATARRAVATIVNFVIHCAVAIVVDIVVRCAVAIVVDVVVCRAVAIVVVNVVIHRAVAIVDDVIVRRTIAIIADFVAPRAVAIVVDIVVVRSSSSSSSPVASSCS
jgi:hypothetical protein